MLPLHKNQVKHINRIKLVITNFNASLGYKSAITILIKSGEVIAPFSEAGG